MKRRENRGKKNGFLEYHSVAVGMPITDTMEIHIYGELTAGEEIDYIEEIDGKLYAYEFKWGGKKTPQVPQQWVASNPETYFIVINRDNYLDSILS